MFTCNQWPYLLSLRSLCFQEKVDLGELMLSLCYLPTAGRLTVTIIKARSLKAMDITGTSGNSYFISLITLIPLVQNIPRISSFTA